MCGPCYVLDTFGFSLVLWAVLGWNVCFCVLGHCALHWCMLSGWSVVCGLRAARVLVGGDPRLVLHLPPWECCAAAAPAPCGMLYLMYI